MSIATTLQSIRTNLTAAWAALTAKGATIPPNKNVANLAAAIATVPSGSNKLPSVVDRSVTTITSDDLAGATNIGPYAFYNCSSLTSITIPDSVTRIMAYAFNGSGLTSIDIPDSVTSIGANSFYNLVSLTNVIFGNSVTSIGDYAFYRCSSLTSITISDSVTSIGYSAFNGCSGLTSITIGNGVTSIGGIGLFSGYSFANCSSLTSITIKATTPPTLLNVSVFNNTNDCPIYVPAESVSAYQTATNWASFASRIQAIPA